MTKSSSSIKKQSHNFLLFLISMIAQKSIQEVVEVARIEDVVGDFVNLKRRGANMLGLCPFHNEKTPSFTVSPTKNIFKCFGCGKGGDAISFMMEHQQLSYVEAIRYLAQKYRIQLEETVTSQESIQEKQLLDSLYIVNDYARDYFQQQLFETDQGKSVGLSYFKQRGFREETIRKFGLGFAQAQKNDFTLDAINKGYKKELLEKLGLTTKWGNDFFRDRVMFTIHNLTGKVIAFAGRILDKEAKMAKYMNSPETEVYLKSKVLYGAYFAKRSIRKKDECILVEGYTDVISLHQSGIENVVASSGTSLTIEQIRLIKRFTPNIKIIYDGDPAGIKAALRGLDLVLEQDLNVKVVLLPKGEDPDSYLQKVGSTDFEHYIDQEAKDFIMFKTSLLLGDAAGDPIKKAAVIKDIVSSIARIPDPIKRSLYIRECANEVGVSEDILVNAANQELTIHLQNRRNQQKREAARNKSMGSSDFPTTEYPPGVSGSPSNYHPADFPSSEYSNKQSLQPGGSVSGQSGKQKTIGNEFQERDIVRILVAFGHHIFDKEENISVAEFVLGNIEEVLEYFDNSAYGKIVNLYHEKLVAGQSINSSYFLHHSDQEIKKTCIDLIQEPYNFSEKWEERFGITLQTQPKPDDNFNEDSKQSIQRFKLKKIIKLCIENQERLANTSDPTEQIKILTIQQRLIKIRDELAKQFGGTVVLK